MRHGGTGQRDSERFAARLRRHGHGLEVEKRGLHYFVLIDGVMVTRFPHGRFDDTTKRRTLKALRGIGVEV